MYSTSNLVDRAPLISTTRGNADWRHVTDTDKDSHAKRPGQQAASGQLSPDDFVAPVAEDDFVAAAAAVACC
ncbi:MAG: hypothetical protein R3B13_34420 [Polyangiaceae bacterium]